MKKAAKTAARTAMWTIPAAAFAVGVMPAVPALAESALVTIGQLEAQGFDVRVDRVGSAPLDECEVTAIRNPQEQKRFVRFDSGKRDRVIEVVVNRTITVSLDCSR